jgi:hypothetical protein
MTLVWSERWAPQRRAQRSGIGGGAGHDQHSREAVLRDGLILLWQEQYSKWRALSGNALIFMGKAAILKQQSQMLSHQVGQEVIKQEGYQDRRHSDSQTVIRSCERALWLQAHGSLDFFPLSSDYLLSNQWRPYPLSVILPRAQASESCLAFWKSMQK